MLLWRLIICDKKINIFNTETIIEILLQHETIGKLWELKFGLKHHPNTFIYNINIINNYYKICP